MGNCISNRDFEDLMIDEEIHFSKQIVSYSLAMSTILSCVAFKSSLLHLKIEFYCVVHFARKKCHKLTMLLIESVFSARQYIYRDYSEN